MAGINTGDEVSFGFAIANAFIIDNCILALQKLVFESSEAVSVISTFDDLGLKEDLVRGIYAYSIALSSRLVHYLTCDRF